MKLEILSSYSIQYHLSVAVPQAAWQLHQTERLVEAAPEDQAFELRKLPERRFRPFLMAETI